MLLESIDPGRAILESQRIAVILADSGERTLRRAGERMLECCSFQRVYKQTMKEGLIIPLIRMWKCGKRGCLVCDRYRCSVNIAKLFVSFKEFDMENIKFITCTFKHKVRPEQLRETLNILTTSLTKLFSRKMLNCVTGGFKALEAVCDDQGFLNPHCHMLLHFKDADLSSNKNVLRFIGSDIFQEALFEYSLNSGFSVEKIEAKINWYLERGLFHQVIWSALFKSVGLGTICKIENVDQGSAAEVAKYFTKTWTVPDEYICDVFREIKGKRLTTFFGDFKIKNDDERRKDEILKVEYVGTVEDVIRTGLATESPFEMSVAHKLCSAGYIQLNVLDVPVLNAENWRKLSKEVQIEILAMP
ncbi:MAG: protein rep [Nitrospinae bacterium]|nr:protein rep [Nitrospinota bacterium]